MVPEVDERTKVLTGKKALQRLRDRTDFHDPHKNPWDQLMGEPIQWFARFELYRALPIERRNIRYAYSEYRKLQHKDAKLQPVTPSTWNQMASRWRWKPRAEAWDRWQIEQDRVAFDDQRRKERKARIETLATARTLLSNEIASIVANPGKVKEMKFRDLLLSLALVMKEQRTEFGEASSIQRTEITGVGGGPVEHQVDAKVSELSVARLMEGLTLEQVQALKAIQERLTNDDVIEGEIVAIEAGGTNDGNA